MRVVTGDNLIPEELTNFSVFSGIGGLEIAAEWAGWKTIGQVEKENDPFEILCKYWKSIPKWRDIHDVRGEEIIRTIGKPILISAGFPCQPHSNAGKHKASCDERDLWPDLRRIICEIKPRWFLGENVPGLLSSENGRFFGGIIWDLAGMGYSVGWGCWEAADFGAPHHRKRIFIIAYDKESRSRELSVLKGRSQQESINIIGNNCRRKISSDTEIQRLQRNKSKGNSCDRRFSLQCSGKDEQSIYAEKERKQLCKQWNCAWPEVATSLCRMDDGLSDKLYRSTQFFNDPMFQISRKNRSSRIRMLGNSVVPIQAYPLFKEIAEFERKTMRGQL